MRKRHLWISCIIVAVLAVLALISCGGGGGGSAGPDTTAPTVSSTNPTNGAAGVATSVAVTATFNEAMDSSTITASTFLVSTITGTISGSVSYNTSTHTATFTPASALVSSTTYTATITTGVTDAAGNPMAADKVWSFQTTAPTSGSLDPTFGTLGISITDVSGAANGVAIQSDGKIVVAGGGSGFVVTRYDTNGSLDPTFGTNGKVTTTIGTSSSVRAVAVQTDGKIVVAGNSSLGVTVARYDANGTLDTAFNSDGIVTYNSTSYSATAVAIDGSGNIVLAGDTSAYSTSTNSTDFFVMRFTPDGLLDTTFSSDGKAFADFKSPTYDYGSALADHAYAVGIQSDGKIVVAGSAENTAWLDEFAAAQFDTNGTLLKKATYDFGNSLTDNRARAIAITPGDGIVLAGVAEYRYFGVMYLGSTLGLSGTVKTDLKNDTTSTEDFAYSVALQSDGKVVVAGVLKDAYNPYPKDFAIVRYQANGSLDTGFGNGGIVITDTGSTTDSLYAVAIQPSDGKIVAAGTSAGNVALVRYIP